MRSPSTSGTSGFRGGREAEGALIACAPGGGTGSRPKRQGVRPPHSALQGSAFPLPSALPLRLSLPFFRTLSPSPAPPHSSPPRLLLHRPGPRGCPTGCPPCSLGPLVRPPRPHVLSYVQRRPLRSNVPRPSSGEATARYAPGRSCWACRHGGPCGRRLGPSGRGDHQDGGGSELLTPKGTSSNREGDAIRTQPALRSSSRTTRRSVSSSSSLARYSRSAWLMAVW